MDAGGLLIPAVSAAASWRGPLFLGPARLCGTAGLGLWSGSIGGRQAGDLDRASSNLVLTLEAVPGIEAAFPFAGGLLLTQLRLGFGFALGPVTTIDVLPGLRTVSRASPDFLHRFIAIAGVGIGYKPGDALAFLVRAEGSLADFDAAAESGSTLMGRLLLVVQYSLASKESTP